MENPQDCDCRVLIMSRESGTRRGTHRADHMNLDDDDGARAGVASAVRKVGMVFWGTEFMEGPCIVDVRTVVGSM